LYRFLHKVHIRYISVHLRLEVLLLAFISLITQSHFAI